MKASFSGRLIQHRIPPSIFTSVSSSGAPGNCSVMKVIDRLPVLLRVAVLVLYFLSIGLLIRIKLSEIRG